MPVRNPYLSTFDERPSVFGRSFDPDDAIAMAERLLRSSGARAKVVRLAPEWKPGDVVVVRFRPGDTPFTYVRGVHKWPGERYDKTDAQIDELYVDGKVEPVLQSGGVPFDARRLA